MVGFRVLACLRTFIGAWPLLVLLPGKSSCKDGLEPEPSLSGLTQSRSCGLMQRGFDPEWLGSTFSKAVYIGNGLMAIISGLVANILVETLGAGFVSPFDAASVVLAGGAALILRTWTENYGDGAQQSSVWGQLGDAMRLIASGEGILLPSCMLCVPVSACCVCR